MWLFTSPKMEPTGLIRRTQDFETCLSLRMRCKIRLLRVRNFQMKKITLNYFTRGTIY